mgnify:CR=1 FL=1
MKKFSLIGLHVLAVSYIIGVTTYLVLPEEQKNSLMKKVKSCLKKKKKMYEEIME